MFTHALRNIFSIILVALLCVAPVVYASELVNINTADSETLKTLKGVGDVIAQRIIDYRTDVGYFQSIEEIKNVSGIGDVTYSNIKDFITVDGGVENVSTPAPSVESSGASSPQDVPVDTKYISANAGADRTLFAGADSIFEGEAIGLQGEPLENARYMWTFGNGDRREGKTFFYNFPYPGTYVVILDVASGKYSATDRMKVTVVPAEISIPTVTDEFIELANHNDVEMDLGGWMLLSDNVYFTFPPHTILLSKDSIRIANARTGLHPSSPSAVSLLYPNGTPATSYEVPLVISRQPLSLGTKTSSVVPVSPPPAVEYQAPSDEVNASNPVLQTGSAMAGRGGGESSIFPWIMGVVTVVLVALGGVFFVRRKRYSEYEIQEIE